MEEEASGQESGVAGSRSEAQAISERRIVERAREWRAQKGQREREKEGEIVGGRVRKRVCRVIWKVVVGRSRGERLAGSEKKGAEQGQRRRERKRREGKRPVVSWNAGVRWRRWFGSGVEAEARR